MGSLRVRVLVWVSAVLVAIFALTTIGLDIAFRNLNERSLDESAHL